jgi:hypothetical protein
LRAIRVYRLPGVVVDDPELVRAFGGVVVEPGVLGDPGVVEDGAGAGDLLLVPGVQGYVFCPGAAPACGSLSMRPEFVVLVRALDPSRVVVELLPLNEVLLPVVELFWLFVDADPLLGGVLLGVVLLFGDGLVVGLVDEPFAGVQGTCVVFDGVCPADEPVVELCAAAYPPIDKAAAKANALIVVMCRFIRCSLGWNSGNSRCMANADRKCSAAS